MAGLLLLTPGLSTFAFKSMGFTFNGVLNVAILDSTAAIRNLQPPSRNFISLHRHISLQDITLWTKF